MCSVVLLIAVFILVPLEDREGMLFASAGFSVVLVAGVLLCRKESDDKRARGGDGADHAHHPLDRACLAPDRPRVDERALFHRIPCSIGGLFFLEVLKKDRSRCTESKERLPSICSSD